MVAAHADGPDLGQAGDHAIGVRAVADDVTEVPDGIHRPGVREHGVEGDKVAVDVGDDGDPHRGSA